MSEDNSESVMPDTMATGDVGQVYYPDANGCVDIPLDGNGQEMGVVQEVTISVANAAEFNLKGAQPIFDSQIQQWLREGDNNMESSPDGEGIHSEQDGHEASANYGIASVDHKAKCDGNELAQSGAPLHLKDEYSQKRTDTSTAVPSDECCCPTMKTPQNNRTETFDIEQCNEIDSTLPETQIVPSSGLTQELSVSRSANLFPPDSSPLRNFPTDNSSLSSVDASKMRLHQATLKEDQLLSDTDELESISDAEEKQAESLKYAVTIHMICKPIGYKVSVGTILKYPIVGEDREMRNQLLYVLDRRCKQLHVGRHALFSAVYDQIRVPDHVRQSFLRGYMLSYISLEWDDIEELIKENLKSRNMDHFSYLDLVRLEGFDGLEISLLCMARMFETVIGAISGDTLWLSSNTLKFDEIAIIVGLDAAGNVYSTGRRSKPCLDLSQNIWLQQKPPHQCEVRRNRLSLNRNKPSTAGSYKKKYIEETALNYRNFKHSPHFKSAALGQPAISASKKYITKPEEEFPIHSTGKKVSARACGPTVCDSNSASNITTPSRNSAEEDSTTTITNPTPHSEHTSQANPSDNNFEDWAVTKEGSSSVQKEILPLDAHLSENESDVSDVNTQAKLFDYGDKELAAMAYQGINDNADESNNQPDGIREDNQPDGNREDNAVGVQQCNEDAQETGDFQCSRCFREFSDYIRYTSHIHECQGTRRRYRCIYPGCTREYSQRSVMLQHHKSVHEAKPFLCTEPHCQHKYSSQKALKAHIQEHHKHCFKFQCQVCSQRFLNRSQYNIHLTRHTNIKPFGCLNCKKASYSTAAQLNQNVSMCLFGSQFCCQICGKNFATQVTMRQHIQNMHQNPVDFRCDLCPKVYRQYASLYKHRIQKHSTIWK